MPGKSNKPKRPKVEKTVHQQLREIEKRERQGKRVSQGLAIVALLLNILILPGLGSLIAGKIKSGIIQLVLLIVGFFLFLTMIGAVVGVPMMIIAWIWALITGINIVRESH